MCAAGADLIAAIEARGFRQDPEARTLAFFAVEPCTGYDRSLLGLQKALAETSGRANVRLSLHGSPEDDFHDMLILEWPGSRYYRPHRHPSKGETIHLIEGRAAALVLDDEGEVARAFVLDSADRPLARIAAGHWHLVLPLSAPVVYHESKKGPFVREVDAEHPLWAPDGRDAQEARFYMERLARQAGLA